MELVTLTKLAWRNGSGKSILIYPRSVAVTKTSWTQRPSVCTDQKSQVNRWISAEEATRSPEPVDPQDPLIYRSIRKLWPEWHKDAVCLGDPDGTHFGTGRSSESTTYNSANNKIAKAQCAVCPVWEQCLTASFEFREEYGIWAGITRKERITVFRDISDGLLTEAQAVSILLQRRNHGRV